MPDQNPALPNSNRESTADPNDETRIVGEEKSDPIDSSEMTGPLDVTIDGPADTSMNVIADAEVSAEDLSVFESSVLESDARSIGRYQVERKLGAGGFGQVLLATDTDLRRRVAIKIPFKDRIANPQDVQRFLDEARVIALLDHPGVVPIYDFGQYEDRCYVVCKFIEGGTLAERIKHSDLSREKIVEMLCSIADTLDFIHQSGVVHRDIKPANILLDENQSCYISDFGLAIHDNSLLRKPGRVGTVAYMSPEQARGESHLVDGRSDLFSLGLIMYEMLCGSRPFVGTNWQQTVEKICDEDPVPPRQIDPTVPKELERICLKLLSKQAAMRYATARDLLEDLEFFQEHGPKLSTHYSANELASESLSNAHESADELVGIVPRGLRYFDQEDGDYFRKLLPGPTDRSGLPDSIQFWRKRIESTSSLDTFRLGVIYGSSGSGKSSFVRAGLFPVLDDKIIKIVVEASAEHTESRLLAAIRASCSAIPDSLSLVDSFQWIRNNDIRLDGSKMLVVIDQFEQWLHAWDGRANTPLNLALRQCDAITLQCILLVRDDYWVGVSRLAELSDVDLVRSENLGMIDLFDKRHARTVLAEYGRSYTRLPGNLSKLSSDQNGFLDRAIDGLAVDGKIVPVQLVTFAEIMKSRPWTVKSLDSLGGIEGVGIRFLEETLGQGAPAENRAHSAAVGPVLKSLMPEAGSNLKGSMRSEEELRVISGYKDHPRRFAKLISILDKDLRLITPTDSGGEDPESTQRHFQLTHDYLVPAIRNWLQRNQRLTLRGRASLRLADRADVWTSRNEYGMLPGWLEWLSFLTLTSSERWDDGERRMMRSASRKHILGTILGLTIALFLGWYAYDQNGKSKSDSLVDQLATATANDTPSILDRLDQFDRWSKLPLGRTARENPIETPAGLRSRIALLRQNRSDRTRFDELSEHLLKTKLSELPVLLDELGQSSHLAELSNRLWSVLKNQDAPDAERLNAALALAAYAPQGDSSRSSQWDDVNSHVVDLILDRAIENSFEYPLLISMLTNRAEALWDSVYETYRFSDESDRQRMARNLIYDLWGDDHEKLLHAFLDANDEQIQGFLPKIDAIATSDLFPTLRSTVRRSPTTDQSPEDQQFRSNRQVNAAALLMRRNQFDECWELLKRSPIPNTRSGLIERAVLLNVDPNRLVNRFPIESDKGIQSAILMTLGTFDSSDVPNPTLSDTVSICRKLFLEERDAELHAVAQWILRKWDFDAEGQRWMKDAIDRLSQQSRPKNFEWNFSKDGRSFIRVKMDTYRLEVSSHEITLQEYNLYDPNVIILEDESVGSLAPVALTSWYDAVSYCRWLTKQAGLTEEDQCHPPDFDQENASPLYADYLDRKGFRLLTTDEWEKACFGDVMTRFSMGHDYRLLGKYGWTSADDETITLQAVLTKKPVQSGMFGAYGNVMEWCTATEYQKLVQPVRGLKVEMAHRFVLNALRQSALAPKTQYYSTGFRIGRLVDLPKSP